MKKFVNMLLYALLLAVVLTGMLGITHFIAQEEERAGLEAEKRLAAKNDRTEDEPQDGSGQPENIRMVLVSRLPVYEDKKIVKIRADRDTQILSYGDPVTVLEEDGLYSQIQTENGRSGYVWSDCIGILPEEEIQTGVQPKVVVIDVASMYQDQPEQDTQGGQPEEGAQSGPEQDAAAEPGQGAQSGSGQEGGLQEAGSEPYAWSLKIAGKLEKKLEDRGYTAVMACRSVEDAIGTAKSVELSNQIKADAVIHIGIDTSGDPAVSGAAVYCSTSGSQYPAAKYDADSRKLGKKVLKYYTQAVGFESAGILESDAYAEIWKSRRPVVLLRMGYLSNEKENAKMRKPKFQARMARGIADGIEAYFGLTKQAGKEKKAHA